MEEKIISIGIVGLGKRGRKLIETILLNFSDIEIEAISDNYNDRIKEAQEIIKDKKGKLPYGTTNFKDILTIKSITAVLVCSSWESNIKISTFFLGKGIGVAMEVGRAYTIDELWELVNTYEKTKAPFMLMENCCFDKNELMITKMCQEKLFGNIVHISGGYFHDLREEIAGGEINRHYRLNNYINYNAENYPTHEIGPIAKILNINRGNKFKSLISIGSPSMGLNEYINNNLDKYKNLKDIKFKQSDIVNTLITCENGETISITLDTTLPRFYERKLCIKGTKGFYDLSTNLVFIEGIQENLSDSVEAYKKYIDNGKTYEEKFLPDIWKKMEKENNNKKFAIRDFLEFRHFIDCIKNKSEPFIDVYDAASWMAISVLSETSIKNNGEIQNFPDFTHGEWKNRIPKNIFS